MYLPWILLHVLDVTIFIFRLNLFQIDIILFSLHLRIYCTHVYVLRILNITRQVFFLTG